MWTIEIGYGGRGDQASAAATVEDCRTECINNADCTAIDWVTWRKTGKQCWLAGPWTTSIRRRRGIHRHTIDRSCGQQWLFVSWN